MLPGVLLDGILRMMGSEGSENAIQVQKVSFLCFMKLVNKIMIFCVCGKPGPHPICRKKILRGGNKENDLNQFLNMRPTQIPGPE